METTTHSSCSDHSTSISSYGVWGAMAEIYNIFNIFLFELFVISNTSICKTYLFKFFLSLSLTLLNSLSLLNSEKKCKLKCFNISQKYLYIKNK